MFVIFKCFLYLKTGSVYPKNVIPFCFQIIGYHIPPLCVLFLFRVSLLWRWRRNDKAHFVSEQFNNRILGMYSNLFGFCNLSAILYPDKFLPSLDSKIKKNLVLKHKLHK